MSEIGLHPPIRSHRWARPRGILAFFRKTRGCSRCGARVRVVKAGPRGGKRYEYTDPMGGTVLLRSMPLCK